MRSIPLIFPVVLILLTLVSCEQNTTLFSMLDPKQSGIDFNNVIIENDSINPIDLTNIYNGGGVGVGDFNNDGLQDLYFTASMVSNKLYLNKGDLSFRDITASAGVSGEGKWCRGVSVIDINADGWMDMYVSASIDKDPEKRKNLLYINKGLDKNGLPFFVEQAAAYGLDDTTHTTMAAFFDYDNDGDLDVYLLVNEILRDVNPSVFKPKVTDGSFPSTGRLYRNTQNAATGHPVFTDVSQEAGVTIEGYGHGVNICDINKDGWKDIFVTNDFVANDLLYINNGDGTFTDKAASYFKHSSANGMGQDVIDINNDGLSDIIVLDMSPEDNYRRKMMLNSPGYQTFQLNDFFKYQYQYVRNTLQVNQGPRLFPNDSLGDPIFGDVGYFSGIAETDWSWTPLVADFDNDGLRDLVVTNGFPKDITDHDFIAFRREAAPVTEQSNTLAQIPEVKLHNYAYRNAGDCRFEEVSRAWGFDKVSFASGAAYADLDNDGDLDMIVNNINDPASVYENTMMSGDANRHYLSVRLTGDRRNPAGLGAWVEIYYEGSSQVYEQTPYRGYLSTIQLDPHFGLDTIAQIDSLVVKWPGGKKQVLNNVPVDQKITVDIKNATDVYNWDRPEHAEKPVFTDITPSAGIDFQHAQRDYVDFRIQKLLPHKFSEYGPSLAAGDLNGDGLDDLIVGGNSMFATTALIQRKDGAFQQSAINTVTERIGIDYQDMGMALFDADGDGDLDLYVSHGGYERKGNTPSYQDQFYINDGRGNFRHDSSAIPVNMASKSCVRTADYDKDGDLDLFIAGRLDPWNYPVPVSSFIYRNDSKGGQVKFTDVTEQVAKGLTEIGLVCDGLFTDFDNDGWPDLILAGEWMPVTFFKNEQGTFRNVTAETGLSDQTGWWNSLAAGDFDNDGDMDYVVGNLGQNSFFKASTEHPVSVYAKDFDRNGSYDAIISLFLPVSHDSAVKKEFPAHLRDDLVKQIIGMRTKFQNYKSYATATMDQVLSKEQLEDAYVFKATNFNSSYCRNDGNGKFTLTSLPLPAQWSALNGIIAEDLDGDGNLDLLFNTNDFSTDVSIGRYDALNGLLLKGDGNGNFRPLSILESGIFIPGNGKALVKLRGHDGKYLVAAGQNRGPLKLFALHEDRQNQTANDLADKNPPTKDQQNQTANALPDKNPPTKDLADNRQRHITVLAGDLTADIVYRDGKKQKHEFYSGGSFLSQSARFIRINKNVAAVTIRDNKGNTRRLEF